MTDHDLWTAAYLAVLPRHTKGLAWVERAAADADAALAEWKARAPKRPTTTPLPSLA
jgi:hypothetical protein